MYEEIKSIINDVLPQCELENITPDSHLTSDLGIDSVKILMLAIQIEDHFHIQFKDDTQLETVQDLIDFIEKSKK